MSLRFVLAFALAALAQNTTVVGAQAETTSVEIVRQAGFSIQTAARLEQAEAGQFDFYVLALSWSPSFCAASQEGARSHVREPQCAKRHLSFVVHGLWPQFERGFPSFCQVPPPPLDSRIVTRMLDLMPSPRLIYHEWERHGTCSGYSASAYFEKMRQARAAVKIPEAYANLEKPILVTPSEVRDAFVRANPGLSPGAFAVICDRKRLREVRLCFTKDLSFRACPQVVHRSCRRDNLEMPAVRGERSPFDDQ